MSKSDRLLGAQFQERREALGMTRSHVAEVSGYPIDVIEDLETGQSRCSLRLIRKIAGVVQGRIRIQLEPVSPTPVRRAP